MSRLVKQAVLVCLIAFASLGLAEWLTPRTKLADVRDVKVDLEAMVPAEFGSWRLVPGFSGGIINPVQEANLKRLYSQTLSRTYVSARGERVMLSIAYGEDQRKYLAVHYPEVCYPAQGFAVRTNTTTVLKTSEGTLPMRRLETFMGPNRYEPVSYWTTMGDYTSFGGMPRRMIELRYGVQRLIPDGLLFRVSTVGRNSEEEFIIQERFITELLASLPASTRSLLTGTFQQ